jgi:hypothetical protein
MVCLSRLQHCLEVLFRHESKVVAEIYDGYYNCTLRSSEPQTHADTVKFIDLLRQAGEKDTNLLGRILLCRFLATSTLIVLARAEDNIEKSVSIRMISRRRDC